MACLLCCVAAAASADADIPHHPGIDGIAAKAGFAPDWCIAKPGGDNRQPVPEQGGSSPGWFGLPGLVEVGLDDFVPVPAARHGQPSRDRMNSMSIFLSVAE